MSRSASRSEVEQLASELLARLTASPDLKTAGMRVIRREFSKRLVRAESDVILDLARRIYTRPGPFCRCVAYELIRDHPEAPSCIGSNELEEFGSGLKSWCAVDTFACFLAGPAWRVNQVPDSLIRGWARRPDFWWRRAALVSTVPLNNKSQGGHGDAPRTLDICGRLIHDREDMVVKALSWALRELAKRDPARVRVFLTEQEDELPPRVLREVGNKLRTGLKNPRTA
jgi:3-methyladenine DNA glycosylase AlkD